ncbi:MAG: hypothetical protein WBF79_15990 [Rhodococcus sp. (in: high G+C Gram-positive bacteria)]
MASNSKRSVLSNGDDWVTVFHDGRVKVASHHHLWEVVGVGRHSALGQYVTLGVGKAVESSAGENPATPAAADYTVSLLPDQPSRVAATVAATNGTFVQFLHDGSVTVGSDGRDIAETFNTGRDNSDPAVASAAASGRGSASGRGGCVTVTFRGSYRPSRLRDHDFLIEIPTPERPALNRLYAGEYESRAGKIGPFR